MRARALAFLLAAIAAAEPVERREIRSVDEFEVRPGVAAVFLSSLAMCGYCQSSADLAGIGQNDAPRARSREY